MSSQKLLTPVEALDMAKSQLFSRCIICVSDSRGWFGRIDIYHPAGDDNFFFVRFDFDKNGYLRCALEALTKQAAEGNLQTLFDRFPESPVCFKKPQVAVEYSDENPQAIRDISDCDWKVFQGWVLLRSTLNAKQNGSTEENALVRRVYAKLREMNDRCMLHQRFMRIVNPATTY